jgi:phospholipid/cholesterol/gamma-HCH transport system ATP-binding protein
MREETIAIPARDLVVGFGKHTVIDQLSLDVRAGEIIGLVGAAGGSKSVLLRAMIGLLPRRGGEIALPVAAGSQARRRGVLFQQGALFSALNARQNIQFPLREAAHLSGTLLDEIANAKLEMVGLTPEDGDKLPSELSGGMTKRVALARALALDPALLFLDEPTPGLDPIAAGEFDTLIKALQETLWFTVFMITHDLNTLAAVCDRVAAFADGKIVALGPLSSVLASDHPWVKAYFHGARAQMLHLEASEAKLLQSFENYDIAHAPLRADNVSEGGLRLVIDIRQFDIGGASAPLASISLSAKLVDASGHLQAARAFETIGADRQADACKRRGGV